MIIRRVLAAILFVGPAGLSAGTSETQQLTSQLETATAELRVVPQKYRVDGLVEAVHHATLSAQILGQVERIHYDVDDRVQRGDLLIKLRDSEYRSRLMQAEAELQSATAALEQLRDEFTRIAGLHRKGLTSESDMDKAEAELRGASARYDAAVAALEAAGEHLRYTEIRAPHTGLVTERHVQVGEVVSPGQPMMSGISLDHLKIMIDVPQSAIPALRDNRELHVHLPDGDDLIVYDITIYPIADSGSSSFRVRADLPEGTSGLFPGMFVKAFFIAGHKQVLVVPQTAVVKRSEVTGLYVVGDDDRIHFRQIRVGRELGTDVVVLAGLSPGERAAVDPIVALATLKREVSAAVRH
jgi:RND family efflux transporter MFP subunit